MTRATYRDPRWREVRLAVLERDGHTCQLRRSKCRTLATEVDHIVAVSDGGAPFDPRNLRAACKSCNIGQRNERIAALAKQARNGTQDAPSTPKPVGVPPLPDWPTQAEYKRHCGYDWPAPPEGWRPEHLPPDAIPPSWRRR